MFKGFQTKSNQFHGFPNLNFQMNNSAYGFSGCTFWLDAAYGLNTQTDLGAISYWQSRIGNITFVQQTSGNQPRFIASDPNLNNLPSVQFVDISRYMSCDVGGVVTMSFNYTLVWIGKVDTYNAQNVLIGNFINSQYYLFTPGCTSAGSNGFCYYSNGSFRATGTTESTTGRICIYKNSSIMNNGTIESTFTALDATLYSVMTILNGASGLAGNVGRTSELLIFGYKMNDDEIDMLSQRINNKYAIY